ncbi:MAG: serine/threonine protein kinase [Chloroflexota bacterium]|nr:serine/threonine protein kinase [Chloroflexota bacterium]PLS78050.1 MAG: hypothetical protein CYG59_20575 [Chloroflexota bacterium]
MSAASPTNSPLLHNRYRILSRLGEGRLATVYRAEDERLRRHVLVHLLRTELVPQENLRRRFEEEARRGAQLSHPGLLEVYDSGDVSGRPYMVTEDIAGQPLADVGLLNPGEALGVVRTVVSAVAMAQSQGVPHPPVSSRNVWLLPGGRAVLLENWTIPPSETVQDLAPYRAPERAAGGPPTPATSVYALGILAWETFVGRRPFDPQQPLGTQANQELPPISTVRPAIFSPELDRIVAQAVAPDPSLRYTTPIDFGRALDHYADASTAQTGRLATLPTGITATVPAQPTPVPAAAPAEAPQVRPKRAFRRAQQAAPAVAPPPPPPVLQAPPPSRTMSAPAPQYNQQAVDQQIKREVKRQVRRQGCQRALIKRTTQLVLVFLLLYGIYLGIGYTYDWATGRLAQINPTEWLTSRLPNPSDFVPSWLRNPGELTATYRVTRPVRLRSSPGASADTNIVKVLEAGSRVQQIGPPEADPDGQPYTWLRVIVLDDGTQGWIANLEGLLE